MDVTISERTDGATFTTLVRVRVASQYQGPRRGWVDTAYVHLNRYAAAERHQTAAVELRRVPDLASLIAGADAAGSWFAVLDRVAECDLSDEGRAAIDAAIAEYGLTH